MVAAVENFAEGDTVVEGETAADFESVLVADYMGRNQLGDYKVVVLRVFPLLRLILYVKQERMPLLYFLSTTHLLKLDATASSALRAPAKAQL